MIERSLLTRTAELAADHLESIGDRHAGPIAGFDELREALGGPLPETGLRPTRSSRSSHAAPSRASSPRPGRATSAS